MVNWFHAAFEVPHQDWTRINCKLLQVTANMKTHPHWLERSCPYMNLSPEFQLYVAFIEVVLVIPLENTKMC